MKRGPLANVGLKRQNPRQSFEHPILHQQVVAAARTLSVPTVPAIAEGVPPHANGSLQRFVDKQLSEKKIQ